ncbi:ABC transporter ATP-binding protein [Dactylosporangium sp. CS-033363]|uniref:ABC transporter ATP-binding protein n=1 Tax=Dactylosporangium sp. CS-033363 TaxID=3239935 RepID=UPI003D89F4C6
MAEALIELDGVTKTYPGPPPVPVLHGVSLAVRPGELVAIVGPSGSGKSTLLNMLGLLDRPTGGIRRVGGRDTGTLSEREVTALRSTVLGFVFQAFHLVGHLDARGNVLLPLVHQGTPRGRRRERADAALDRVGMGHRRHARPATLSGGEQQRVAIARAVVHDPGVLLCDEPTGNLDRANTAAVLDLLRELVTPERAVVVVTHDAGVRDRADRVITVTDGHAA